MRYSKVYIIAIFLAVFVLSSISSIAMAHCGHNSFATGESASMDMPDRSDKAEASTCDTHDHGSASLTNSASGHLGEHSSNSVDCDECSGVPCQSQIRIPDSTAPAFCIDADALHSQDSIHFKTIFLSIIPNPPKYIS